MGIRRSILVQNTEHNAATNPLLLHRICTNEARLMPYSCIPLHFEWNQTRKASSRIKVSHPFGAKFGQFVHIGSMLKSSLEFSLCALTQSSSISRAGDRADIAAALSAVVFSTERPEASFVRYSASLAIGYPVYCKCTRICIAGIPQETDFNQKGAGANHTWIIKTYEISWRGVSCKRGC